MLSLRTHQGQGQTTYIHDKNDYDDNTDVDNSDHNQAAVATVLLVVVVVVVVRDVMKFAFEFDNVRTSNVFSRFEIRQNFSRTHRQIRTSGLHDQHHMSMPTGHRNNQLNKCASPNSPKGPKIILDMADRRVSKDGSFRILGNALTHLLSDFFGITFLHFLS